MTTAALEQTITSIAARLASVAGPPIDASEPLAMAGIDSLGAIALTAELEQTLGCTLPPDLAGDCPDVRTLAARIERHLSEPGALPPTVDPYEQMLDDAALPEHMYPESGRDSSCVARAAHGEGLGGAHRILLTGVTGYLGGWLAKALLERSNAQLTCLVRSRGADASARLRSHLMRCGVSSRTIEDRVSCLSGDLTHEALGLGRTRVHALAASIDAICHAGASVNWILPYSRLRDANVLGTRELIQLAMVRAIPFHFISSLSACYSTDGPREADETFEGLSRLRGIHLGYAQSKVVAEALAAEAGRRGLPVTVYRPSLIAGHSHTGTFNGEDLLASMISGCVRMGAAPDLDWSLDALPVDVVAARILRLSRHTGTFHLAHDRPRHWRECVLWMRLYGYPVRLVPYHAWLAQLERETATELDHPLRALRTFFLTRPPGAGGVTLPELFENSRRTLTRADATIRALGSSPPPCPALDAGLLERYFDAFVAAGHLPPPACQDTPSTRTGPLSPVSRQRRVPAVSRLTTHESRLRHHSILDSDRLTHAIRTKRPTARVRAVTPLCQGSDHSIVSELAAWRSRRPTGVFHCRLTLEDDSRLRCEEVVIKASARDTDVIAVGEALARLCGDRLGDTYARWRTRIGFTRCHERELAVYAQTDDRFVRHIPRVLGMCLPASAGGMLILERINDGVLIDSVDRPQDWRAEHLSCVIDGLAALQACWYGQENELAGKSWIGFVPSTKAVAEMTDLWSAIAEHASPAFSSWSDPAIGAIQRRLIARLAHWWPMLDGLPRTLVHNDFNPRNISVRRPGDRLTLCAFDWELATIGVPQRDLAELLCFVLPDEAIDADIDHWIGYHREALGRETGRTIQAEDWQEGFRAALYDLMLNRLPMYALVHRVRRQSFLPRVVRTWRRLYERFQL